MNIKNFFNKFWEIVWKDDSLKGWLISVIFIFIMIKFVFFPILNFATGTTLPLAIVESCSMYHNGNILSNFEKWWQTHNEKYSEFEIKKTEFHEFPFTKGFNKGDILFITKADPEKLQIGDVIIFNAGTNNPIIHRIISIQEKNRKKIFSTIGDNNPGQLSIEEEISEDQLIGKAVFRIAPYIGWGKLIFFEYFRPQQERGFCTAN